MDQSAPFEQKTAKMRILHLVSYSVYSGPLPGVLLLAQAQKRAGHQVYVVHDAWRGNFSPYEEMAQGRADIAELAAPWPMTLSGKAGMLRAYKDVAQLRYQMMHGAIEVIHCHLSHDHVLSALARAGRCALVRTVHAARAAERRAGSGWMWRRTHGIIARSAQVAVAAGGLPGRAAATNLHVVPGAIDAAAWRPSGQAPAHRAALRAQLGAPEGALLLGHVALMAGRGQQELLNAFAQLLRSIRPTPAKPWPHLVFVGRGPQEVALHRAVHSLGLQRFVHFIGYVPNHQLHEIYSALDGAFVAQPGNDGAARAALEAMAAHVPVVGVATGAMLELIAPQRAFVAVDQTAGAIAAACQSWWAHPHQRLERCQQAARWVATRHSPSAEAQSTCQVYKQALKIRVGAPG